MADQIWTQDSFAKGELSPYMYARAGVQQYYNGLKTAQNVLTYPQGAAGKRFGTLFKTNCESGFTSADDVYFQTFQYLNECVYQVLFRAGNVDIYLEGVLSTTVGSTGLDAQDCSNLDYTVLQNKFRITGAGFKPKDLTRSASTPNVITGVSSNQFTLTNPITNGLVLAARFTTSGALPTTTPQIKVGVTYFVKNTSTSTVKVYASSFNAANDIDAFVLTNAGTGTNNLVVFNAWALTDVTYKNLPVYDFTGGYDALTFTPSATSGAAVTITASGAIFTSAMVGGAFLGGGGVSRITAFTDSTHITVAVEQPFDSTAAISGKLALLAEPAWSDLRGWPQKCSSYQNRALFANTDSLPNGFWASAINDYSDFNDLETDDDDAISWFPTSDEINFIRFIVPYRSVTVHTNSGVFSSPLSVEAAITPKNFSLQLQDSTPADVLRPKAIDNQIIVVSGNDVHSLLWNGLDNAYTSSIVSIMNEQLIRDPVDEAAYVDLRRAGSRYIFIVNRLGSMAIYQTLITEGISGWSPAITEQYYGNSYFRQVATSLMGRAWFLTERGVATAGSPAAISGFGGVGNKQLEVSNTLSTLIPTAIKFTTSGTLPAASPALNTTDYFWAIAVTGNAIKVYRTKEDAEADVNGIVFSSAGTSSNIVPWPLVQTFMIEELTYDTFLDCASYYSGTPTDTVTGQARFNAQNIKMVGDGFGFEGQGNDNEVVFEAHGQLTEVSEAYIGYPINLIIEPMPLTLALGRSQNYLTRPTHIRSVNFMFNNTIGGTINGVPIALKKFDQAHIGLPPQPASGVFEMSIMKAWDDFNNPSFTIEHNDPFNIELLGLFYYVTA